MNNNKPTTIGELLRIPFRDRKFVRFLKEKKLYQKVIENAHKAPLSYHQETLKRDELFACSMASRNYLIRMFPWSICGEDWHNITIEWEQTLKQKNEQNYYTQPA